MSIPRDFNRQPPPIHPGEMLWEEFMQPLQLSADTLSDALRISSKQLIDLIEQRAQLDGDMAYRLAAYFGTTVYFWMNLQGQYQLSLAYRDAAEQIRREVRPRVAA